MNIPYHLEPEGDSAIIIRFHSSQLTDANFSAICVAKAINARMHEASNPYPFLIEAIPAFSTVGVYYHLDALGKTTFTQLCEILHSLCDEALNHLEHPKTPVQTIEIPVCYDPEFGMDLEELSQTLHLSIEEIIALHSANPVRVFMLGFSPGLPYLGVLDEKLNIPRRSTPRVKLAAGSVAIANRQCVIYPYETPGGWHIIGRTPLRLFNPDHPPYTLYNPGDFIVFKPISKEEFTRLSSL